MHQAAKCPRKSSLQDTTRDCLNRPGFPLHRGPAKGWLPPYLNKLAPAKQQTGRAESGKGREKIQDYGELTLAGHQLVYLN
ncbi:hypothetical protein BTVI_130668 [Pitangus sulphuratus]|nr:hypothetical protein BTVI_130668 [Pitangus sulphuratus]